MVCEEIVIDSDGPSTLIRSGYQVNSMMLDFYNQALKRKKCVYANTQSRFASVVLVGVLGPPRLTHLTDSVLNLNAGFL